MTKPLGKKSFWAKTIIDLEMLLGMVDPGYAPTQYKVKQIEQWHLNSIAEKVWDLGDALHGKSYLAEQKHSHSQWYRDWFHAMAVLRRHHAGVSDVVVIRDAYGSRRKDGVGQLIEIDREMHPKADPWAYDEHGGPVYASPRYHICLLNGEIITWGNCSVSPIPTIRNFTWDRDRHAEEALKKRSQWGGT